MTELIDHLRAALSHRYAIHRELGHGGMATVYLADDPKHQRQVAIKVLRPELSASLGTQRFLREIAIAAQLQHPNILMLIDSGDVDGALYYVMPFVDGESLRDRLERETQLPIEEAIRLAGEVADGLSYAHRHGVVHRDIKPENILLTGGHAVIADFGIARAVSAAGTDKLTETGLALGTPLYMSPEQASGAGPVDARADIYALGCVVYEMLGGGPPFTGSTSQAVMARHLTDAPPPLRTVRSTVPVGVEEVINRALAKVPADRFASADEFAQALTQGLSKVAVAAPRRRAIAVRLALALAVPAMVAGWFLFAVPKEAQTRIAVLPFDHGTAEDPSFAYGMSLEVNTQLSKIPALTVIAQGSSSEYAGPGIEYREVASELGVRYLVAARVDRAADSIRISTRIVDGKTSQQVWAETYVRPYSISGVFSLQRDIARSIAGALGAQVAAEEQAPVREATSDLQAYELYVLGQYHHARWTRESWDAALDYFRQAIARDSTFAPAYAASAQTHVALTAYGYLSPNEGWPRVEEFARRALRLNPQLAEAHTALGMARASYHYDWQGADALFRRGIALNPNSAVAHGNYGLYLWAVGRPVEAIQAHQRARDLDPRSLVHNGNLGAAYGIAGQHDKALQQFRAMADLPSAEPGGAGASGIAEVYLDQGKFAEAVEYFEKMGPTQRQLHRAGLVRAYLGLGQRARAEQVLSEMPSADQPCGGRPAAVYVALGDYDGAFAQLDKEITNRCQGAVRRLQVQRALDPLRSDPRFAALLRKLNHIP